MQRALEQQAAQRSSLSESLEYRVDEARKQALDMLNEQRSECEALHAEVRMFAYQQHVSEDPVRGKFWGACWKITRLIFFSCSFIGGTVEDSGSNCAQRKCGHRTALRGTVAGI